LGSINLLHREIEEATDAARNGFDFVDHERVTPGVAFAVDECEITRLRSPGSCASAHGASDEAAQRCIAPRGVLSMIRTALAAALMALAVPAAGFAQTAPAPTAPAATVAPQAKTEPTAAEKEARAKFRAACSADIAKFCSDAMPVAGAAPDQMKAQRTKMRGCIDTHKADLSATCKAAIVERDAAVAAKKS
jgi:hypothetical protein